MSTGQSGITRRELFTLTAAAVAAATLKPQQVAAQSAFELPELGYAYDALEPHIDARTMEIHHSKHHAGYTTKLNAALAGHEELQALSIEQLLADLARLPSEIQTAVRNNGGGYANHNLFWTVIAPGGSGAEYISPTLQAALVAAFGNHDQFVAEFSTAAATLFGSGWAWLVSDGAGGLSVQATSNQDTPLMVGQTPILGLDVWEHAYYLNYQNRRSDYIAAFFQIIHWGEVSRRYAASMG
ncbi:MAG: superoxide dismutase [Chloroflexi bacterium]|nr:superoxide dismutase [Chloroflexota bacterium]